MDGKSKRVIKELKGHSGNKINLCETEGILYVEKTGDIQRNVERLMDLHREMYPLPFIFGNLVDKPAAGTIISIIY